MLRNDNLCDEEFLLLHLNIRSLQRNLNSLSIQCFLMTSRRPYWCPKTMKRRSCWCPKLTLWELYSFLMQMISFVPINFHRCWPREWKHFILLTCLNINFSLIGVSETWLNDYSHSVDIDGFNSIHKHRPNRTGCRVGLYISDNLDFKIRADLSFGDIDVAESLFIEISRPHGKNIIGGVIYRPPNQRVGDFVSKHNDLLAKISRENKMCFIMIGWFQFEFN